MMVNLLAKVGKQAFLNFRKKNMVHLIMHTNLTTVN